MNVNLGGSVELVLTQPDVTKKLDRIIMLLTSILLKENAVMASIQEVIAATEQQKTVLDSLVTFVQGLKDQIANLPGITTALQAQIDQIFANVQANTQEAADAMVANTPAAP